jgi:hypothetical protein
MAEAAEQAQDSWPELTYRYVEHYFWEPQHLFGLRSEPSEGSDKPSGRLEAYYSRIRSQEVPLNYLFNVLMRIMPSAIKRAVIGTFGVDASAIALEDLELCLPRDRPFVQPDMHLESERARVFIECKVNAKTELEQMQRYTMLHAACDSESHGKTPYLLLLTAKPAASHWQPAKEAKQAMHVGFVEFVRGQLKQCDLGPDLRKHRKVAQLMDRYRHVAQNLRFGVATWQQVGDALATENQTRQEQGGELAEIMNMAVGDFLTDLRGRELWTESL